jgi:hypothetical protein
MKYQYWYKLKYINIFYNILKITTGTGTSNNLEIPIGNSPPTSPAPFF